MHSNFEFDFDLAINAKYFWNKMYSAYKGYIFLWLYRFDFPFLAKWSDLGTFSKGSREGWVTNFGGIIIRIAKAGFKERINKEVLRNKKVDDFHLKWLFIQALCEYRVVHLLVSFSTCFFIFLFVVCLLFVRLLLLGRRQLLAVCASHVNWLAPTEDIPSFSCILIHHPSILMHYQLPF